MNEAMATPAPDVLLIDGYERDDGARTVYSWRSSFGDWASIHVEIVRRIEGSCTLHAFGSYGNELDDEAKKVVRALDAIDALKGHDVHRPWNEVSFETREAVAPVTTARQAQAVVDAFLAKRGDVPFEQTSSISIGFNDVRVAMSQDDRPRGRGYAVECTIGKASDAEDYSKEFVFEGDIDAAYAAMWQIYDEIVSGQVTEQSPTAWTAMVRDIIARTAKHAHEYDRIDEMARQMSEEAKERQRKSVAMSDLGNLDRFIDVRALLEADPFFEGRVDDVMADCERANEAHERLISSIAGVLEEVIKPIEDENTDADGDETSDDQDSSE